MPGRPDPRFPLGSSRSRASGGWFLVAICGVLPAAGFASELATRMFSDHLFELFPEWFHVTGVGAALLVNLWLLATRGREHGSLPLRAVLVGFVIGASLLYALVLMPLSLMIAMLLVMGLGFLAAAPYWAGLGTLFLLDDLGMRFRNARRSRASLWGHMVPAILFFPALVIGYELSQRRTLADLTVAACGEGAQREAAVEALRHAPLAPQLAACVHGIVQGHVATRGSETSNLVWFIRPRTFTACVTAEQAQKAFYRVHGIAYSACRSAVADESWFWPRQRWRFERVPELTDGRRLAGFCCSSSRLAVTVERDAACARADWTLELTNTRRSPVEASLDFALPAGAVASALSLWIEGQERPAAFAAEERAARAYDVVAHGERKDPALLREVAPGRLRLLVCPIPAGSTTRVRFAVTVPLDLQADTATLRLPALLAGNLADLDFAHALGIDDGGNRSERRLTTPELATTTLAVPRGADRAWTRDVEGVLVQELVRRRTNPWRGPLVLVLDGSRTADRGLGDPAAVLDAWPADTACTVCFAAAAGVERQEGLAGDPALRRWLGQRRFAGGVDPVPALEEAVRVQQRHPGAVIVWLRGELPVVLESPEPMAQALAKARSPVVSVALAAGPNLVHDELVARRAARVLPRGPDLRDDLQRLVAAGSGADEGPDPPFASFVRRFTRAEAPPEGAPQVSDQLARSWAAAEARRLRAEGNAKDAVALAASHRLVTANCAAVVLETKEQYSRFQLDPGATIGLEPEVAPGNPVPEPATWILLACGLLLVGGSRLRLRDRGWRSPRILEAAR